MESTFDIDLSGDDLPPGVVPGSLGGDDQAPGAATPVEPSTDEIAEARTAAELDADFDAALGDDEFAPEPEERVLADEQEDDDDGAAEAADGDGPPEEVPASESASADAPVEDQGADSPAPTTPPKRKRAAPKRKAAAPKKTNVSGSVARLYFIFKETQAEVDGQVVAVYVKCSFVIDGTAVDTVTARNRYGALKKAGKLFGKGFEGTLVATPASYFEPERVCNEPSDGFKVVVGGAS